jgi:hypothetical protein
MREEELKEGGLKAISPKPVDSANRSQGLGIKLGGSELGSPARAAPSPGSLAHTAVEPEGHARGQLASTHAPGASPAEEATSTMASPTVQERRRRSIAKLFRNVLDLYSLEAYPTISSVRTKCGEAEQYQARCLQTKEEVKTEDVNKEDGQRQTMEKPAKVKSVTLKTQRATKAMSMMMAETVKAIPRVTPTRSNWRIWDPGRRKAHVVLRG